MTEVQGYVSGDVFPIIQNIDRLIAKATMPVADTIAWKMAKDRMIEGPARTGICQHGN